MDRQLQNLPQAGAGLSRMERARLRTVRGLSRLARKSRRSLSDSRPVLEKAPRGARRPEFRGGQDWALPLFLFTGMTGFVIFGLGRLIFH
jgi:hypothetical protein